jgi:hypothetical protein
MPFFTETRNICCIGVWRLFLVLFCAVLVSSAEAQRHPESGGPLPYYNDEPGTTREPEWKQRPPFLRGPQDRIQRGYGRAFLNTEDSVPYLNYAEEKYILYFRETIPWAVQSGRPEETRNVRWDRLGNYMGGNYLRALTMEESRSGSDFSGTSYIDHKYLRFRIGHYSYKDLHWTATVGNGVSGSYVRTIFTPLTLNRSLLNVVRLDLNYKERDRATMFYSRGGEQGTALLFSGWAFGAGDDTWENSPVLMFGGHWQHELGNYASLGGSLLNQIMAFPASSRSDAWRGDLPYDMLGPKTIRIFITDDSPEETQANAKVYGVDVILEGERGGEAVRLTSIDDDPDYNPGLEAGPPSGGTALTGGGREAVGQEAVIYTFPLPPDVTVRSARFVADVAGDYRIGVRQTHDFFSVDRRGNAMLTEMEWPATIPAAGEAASRRPFKWNTFGEEEPYYTVMRSRSRDGSGANRRTVVFDYGMPTGQSLASLNWQAELVGLEISGEVAHNLQNTMFPVGNNEGKRSSERAWAGWLKGVKDLAWGLELGGEVFRMEPDYAGGYDSYRGGMPFHLDSQDLGGRVTSVTQEFPLHEDNDDHDRFPDDHVSDSAVAQPRELYPGFPSSMVYPGLDENVDNIVDVDRNENFIVDWEEAFLTYDSEPPEFVYGIDFNNNGVPDFRENDDLPDYPYPRDQKGRHFFLRFIRLGALGRYISAGNFDSRQIVGAGSSKGIYLRYEYDVTKRGVGALKINFDTKWVKDDIADHTYIYRVPYDDIEVINLLNRPDGPPEEAGRFRPATPDLLLMRDSWVSLASIGSNYQGFHNINLENALLWFRNSQAEIELDDGSGLLQPEDVRTRFSVVNKIDYTWTRGALSVTPKFKHRTILESVDSEEDPRVSYSDFIPIIMGQYRLTPKTSLLAGAQGLPWLNFKHWDRADKDETFSQTDYLAMMKITADYFGIRDNSIFFGYQRTRRNYSRPGRPGYKQGVIFVELISPF